MIPDSDPQALSTRRQLELMRNLQRLASARSESVDRVADEHAAARAEADRQASAAIATADEWLARERSQLEASLASKREQVAAEYEAERSTAQQQYHGLRSAAEAQRREAKDKAQRRSQDEAWEILALFDAQKGQPQQREAATLARLRTKLGEVQTLRQEASTILALRRVPVPEETSEIALPAPKPESDDDGANLDALLADLDSHTERLHTLATSLYKQRLARLFEGLTPFGVVGVIAVVAYAAAAATVGAPTAVAIGTGVAAIALTAAGMWWSARPLAVRNAQSAYEHVLAAAAECETLVQQAVAAAHARRRAEAVTLINNRNADLARLGYEIEQQLGKTKLRVLEQLDSADEVFPEKIAGLREQSQAEIARLDGQLTGGLATLASQHSAQLAAIEQQRTQAQATADETRDVAWQALRDAWLGGYAAIATEAAAMCEACDARFPTDWQAWSPQKTSTPAVEFGRVTVDLARVKSGLSDDERLQPPSTSIELPALVTLAEQPGLVVTAEGTGKLAAQRLLQTMALRWLVGQPPGKVRLTVLDPTGLGESFASLMHLADQDENLIAGRIWSESRDIDEQLLRLTSHLETVIQKYLRSEYATIHDYNAQAGEVAEPFQVLVVNGFPTNFSDATCRRLMNLAASGPRCGVYLMLAVDTKIKPPSEFRLDELLASAVHLDWQADAGRFVWRYPTMEHLPLTVAEPPDDETMVAIVRRAGEAAKQAIRVEVPFAAVAPDDAMWQATCSDELRIPVGRAGANRLQHVQLGKGTSQHLLVAGKTGSGKSTFLHALVTSAALRYSPDELEFYLVDFKKGVEFKAYATHRLPHARVVAIESEREFGLSVLERLDEELTRRGERYREAGVQTLADYRAARPEERTPRLLLVIDEFQELFVQDDRLAQQATLLLDRLVRQGRAFGVHVLLGTQTLAGAYSLARSTLGQIAVRVALACSEADAHLILSDERNQAARFLSRPGEAIYNDQNGLASANEPFQVVWLPDSERADWLAKVDNQRKQTSREPIPTIVFEGNTPADLATNHELTNLLAGGPRPTKTTSHAYLGAAVAIKPPTHAALGRHGGANLLVVGADDHAAVGMTTAAVISLAAENPASRFVIADGSREGEPLADVWPAVANKLPNAGQVDVHAIAAEIDRLATEVARRDSQGDHAAAPIYLVLYHAGRFRDLRRSEDNFSFSIDKDKPPAPDKQLATILRDGPSVGVHVLVWCDSYNMVTRLFDRPTLREFALRVVLPMSAADSSNLIDTPAASQLNQHRALFYNDETGQSEKFRPYGLPDATWLEQITLHGTEESRG